MRTFALAALALLASCARPAVEARPLVADQPAPARSEAHTLPAGNPALAGVVIPVDRTIAENVAAAPTLSIFARGLAVGGLAVTLKGAGPYTVFAPTDEAFGRLAPGTVDALFKSENRASLIKLLNLHIVPGAVSGVQLMQRVAAGGGRATLTSEAGETLTVTMTGGIVTLTDAGGNRSYIETADIRQSNGMLHVVNGVLVPRLP